MWGTLLALMLPQQILESGNELSRKRDAQNCKGGPVGVWGNGVNVYCKSAPHAKWEGLGLQTGKIGHKKKPGPSDALQGFPVWGDRRLGVKVGGTEGDPNSDPAGDC